MKNTIVLGDGGFIGGHLAKTLKKDGYYIRMSDIENHECFNPLDICPEFILADLRDPESVENIISEEYDSLVMIR